MSLFYQMLLSIDYLTWINISGHLELRCLATPNFYNLYVGFNICTNMCRYQQSSFYLDPIAICTNVILTAILDFGCQATPKPFFYNLIRSVIPKSSFYHDPIQSYWPIPICPNAILVAILDFGCLATPKLFCWQFHLIRHKRKPMCRYQNHPSITILLKVIADFLFDLRLLWRPSWIYPICRPKSSLGLAKNRSTMAISIAGKKWRL